MNAPIVGAVVFIAGVSLFKAVIAGQPITRVLIGSYILLGVMAVLDFFGGWASELAKALAMLAVIWVILNEFPWTQLLALLQVKYNQ